MLKTNFEAEFKKYCLQLESIESQLYNTFNLKQKDILRQKIKNMKKWIDKLLDEYNRERS